VCGAYQQAKDAAAKVTTLQGALADFLAANYDAKLKATAAAQARAVDAAAEAAAAGRAAGAAAAQASARADVAAAVAAADRSLAEVAVLQQALAELRAERDEFIVAREAEMAALGDVANFLPQASAAAQPKRSQQHHRPKPRSLKLKTDE
jgi:hypothetical protein